MSYEYVSRLKRQVEEARMDIRRCMQEHEYEEARMCANDILRLIEQIRRLEPTQSQEVVQ